MNVLVVRGRARVVRKIKEKMCMNSDFENEYHKECSFCFVLKVNVPSSGLCGKDDRGVSKRK